MKLLVVGKTGQVATALSQRHGDNGNTITLVGRPDIDLAVPNTIKLPLADAPDLVINAAAYTAVDNAESEKDLAFAVNDIAPGILAHQCADHGVPFLHVSTDYVYKGGLERPALEDDPVEGDSVYGRSKLAGEEAVRQAIPQHIILRTAWVFGAVGNNFVKTMLHVAQDRDELKVVNDQIGNPTSAEAIANATLLIAHKLKSGMNDDVWGTYNFAGKDSVTWAEFARCIFEESAKHSGPVAQVFPITTSEYPTHAKRPEDSRLNTRKFETTFGPVPSWKPALTKTITELLSGQ